MKETELFKFTSRAKECVSRCRPDTYFAIHLETNREVFVKGPLFENFSPETFRDIIEIKEKIFSLPTIDYKIVKCYADMEADDGSYRSRINRNKEYYFIYSDIFSREHITDKERKGREFQKIVAFREFVGIGDTKVNENFLMRDQEIYSVDEDCYFNKLVTISSKSKKILIDMNIKEKVNGLHLNSSTMKYLNDITL